MYVYTYAYVYVYAYVYMCVCMYIYKYTYSAVWRDQLKAPSKYTWELPAFCLYWLSWLSAPEWATASLIVVHSSYNCKTDIFQLWSLIPEIIILTIAIYPTNVCCEYFLRNSPETSNITSWKRCSSDYEEMQQIAARNECNITLNL